MKKWMTGLAFVLSFVSVKAMAFGDKHSKVETKAVAKAQEIELDILVKADAGFKITPEGPWQLTLINPKGLKLETKDGKYSVNGFDEKLSGFKVKAPLEAGVNAGTIEYSVKAFICTEDKKQCYPQLHKGTIDWKRS